MTKQKLSRICQFVFFALGCLGGIATQAASIQQVKGNKVMISLDGMALTTGAEVYALTSDQKRKAVIRINAVKGNRAIGTISKGAAQVGMSIGPKGTVAAPSSSSSADSSSAAAPRSKSFSDAPSSRADSELMRRSKKRGAGFLLGMAMNSAALSAKTKVSSVTYEDSLAMKGNSFGLKGFYDYEMSKNFTIRGAIGLETINTTATTSVNQVCSGSTSCKLALNYLAFEGDAQFNFVNSSSMRLWAGAGYAFLMAMSKDNNITNLEATSTNQVLYLGGGADISIGKTGFVPVVVEYGLFPFAGISLSSINFRAGYGWRF